MDMAIELIHSLGLPGGFALALLYILSKAIYRLGKWAEPKASKFLDTHVDTMNTMKDSVREQTEYSKQTCRSLETLNRKMNEIHEEVKK